MRFTAYIGTLHEDLSDVAWRIQHLPEEVAIVVWIDDRDDVLAAAFESAPSIPSERFVGNYRRGRSLSAIEDDLRALFHERSSKAIAAGHAEHP